MDPWVAPGGGSLGGGGAGVVVLDAFGGLLLGGGGGASDAPGGGSLGSGGGASDAAEVLALLWVPAEAAGAPPELLALLVVPAEAAVAPPAFEAAELLARGAGRACWMSGCSVCDFTMNSSASALASSTFFGGPLITSMGSSCLFLRRTFAEHCVCALISSFHGLYSVPPPGGKGKGPKWQWSSQPSGGPCMSRGWRVSLAGKIWRGIRREKRGIATVLRRNGNEVGKEKEGGGRGGRGR